MRKNNSMLILQKKNGIRITRLDLRENEDNDEDNYLKCKNR